MWRGKTSSFVPTELGFIVVDILKDFFADIVEVEFTARMEEET
jgi:DNA topoisomerase-1